MRRLFLCLMLTLGLLPSSWGSELVLAREGAPEASIFTRGNASPAERYAAEELQGHLHRISGAELPVESASVADPSLKGVVITALEEAPEVATLLGLKTSNLGEEEAVLRREGDTLYLVGRTPRAALYATYTFLQDELGCRWFWPGPEGEYLPQKSTIAVGALARREAPALEYRTISLNHPHDDEATNIWMARQRLNVRYVSPRSPDGLPGELSRRGFLVAYSGHNLILSQELLEAHPEYAAEVGGIRSAARVGRRQAHLCWSNRDVQKALVAHIEDWLKTRPGIDLLNFIATDHTLFCECKECVLMAPDVSTRWQKLLAVLKEELSKSHPDKKITTLAYQAYRDLPQSAAPLGYVGYCAYNANYLQPFLSGGEGNGALKAEMLKWQELGVPLGIRGYEMIPFSEPMWTPLVRYIVEEKQWLKQNGFAGSSSEVAPYGFPKDKAPEHQGWTVNRMTIYAAAQALWNTGLEPDDIIRDWMNTIYGPAAGEMLAYYQMMEAAWIGQSNPLTYFLHPAVAFAGKYLSPERIAQAGEHFARSRERLKDDPRALRQLDLEMRMFQEWQQRYLEHEGRSRHFQTWAPLREGEGFPTDAEWEAAAVLPAFEDRTGGPALYPTEVRILRDSKALYLRVRCEDHAADSIVAKYEGRDENIFGDDSIELFLQPESGNGYLQLAVNSLGAQYDAHVEANANLNVAWNADWKATTRRDAKGWSAELTLPFDALGVKPADTGARWHLAVKRNIPAKRREATPGLRATGWPDASYHNPNAFGQLTFVREVPVLREVALYHSGEPSVNLMGELERRGFKVLSVEMGEAALETVLQSKPALLMVRIPQQRRLSFERLSEQLRDYLEEGGIVVIAATGKLPLDLWFNDVELAVEWSGWEVDARRRTASVAKGEWAKTPNDLAPAFHRRVAPASAYQPSAPERWKALATLKLNDQSEWPYLMEAKVGEGRLILTSSNMSYSGGGEIFGRHHPRNAAALLENLIGGEQ